MFSAILIGFQYIKHKQILHNNIDIQLQDAVSVGKYLIGDRLHNLPFDKTLVSKEENIKNSLLLSTLTNESDITFVYTISKHNDKAYFSCSSVTKEQQQTDGYLPYMLEYKEATSKLLKAFTNHKTYYGEVSESYGKFRSIIMPQKSSNGIWYVIGADIEISYIDKKLNDMILNYIILFVIFILILIPFIIRFQILAKSEKTDALKKQKNILEQNKLAQMGEMIGNISHQWRQPLSEINSIVMNLDTKNINESSQKIENITEYMSETINNFNNFFRIDKEKKIFNVNKIINNSISLCQNLFDKYNTKIIVDINENIKYNGYEGELTQVILAIFKNANDAMVNNDIINPTINILVKILDERVVIDISDNGKGIDIDNLPQIFDPYFTTKFKSDGTGIGLYMSKVIIEKNMNGKLTVINIKNGASFRIVL